MNFLRKCLAIFRGSLIPILFQVSVAFLVLVVWSVYPFLAHFKFKNWQTAGQFGDSFGALNALFSSLAFLVLVITFFIQRKQLKIQESELRQAEYEQRLSKISDSVMHVMRKMDATLEAFAIEQINGDLRKGAEALHELNSRCIGIKMKISTVPTNSMQLILLYEEECPNFTSDAFNVVLLLSSLNSQIKMVQGLLSSNLIKSQDCQYFRDLVVLNIGEDFFQIIDNYTSLLSELLSSVRKNGRIFYDDNLSRLERARVLFEQTESFKRWKQIKA